MAPPTWLGSELVYCSNVHPGTDLAAILANLACPVRAVRERRGLDRMGAGLWLPADSARRLGADPAPLAEALATNGIALFTLNGFPQGDFHLDRVKELVYAPAWDSPERLLYTLDLARVLSACLDPGAEGGTISTLPLGFAPQWSPGRQIRALNNLCQLAERLARLAQHTGRPIRVCLEPEPGCVLETTEDVLRLFEQELPVAARAARVSPETIRTHLGLCWDCCHQSVLFEDPGESLDRLAQAQVPLGKVQISSAIRIDDPTPEILERVARDFAEPRYLHQVRTRVQDPAGGYRILAQMDLPDALADPRFPRTAPWRVHFHVPIHAADLAQPGVSTTQSDIGAVLDRLADWPDTRPHLEVETYTWQVLPPKLRPADPQALTAGLAAELGWLERELEQRGMIGE